MTDPTDFPAPVQQWIADQEELAMTETDISKGAVELPRSIHLGAMNDAIFVIDGKPCPGPYDGPIPKNDGPNALTKAFPRGCDEQLQTICDLYNRQAATLRALLATRERDAAVIEAFENVMGHIDTPISRRKLHINHEHPQWLVEARAALEAMTRERDALLAREGALLERAAEVAWTIGVASGEARAEAIRALITDDAAAALAARDERIRREAVEAELERCARIAEDEAAGHPDGEIYIALKIAAAIRENTHD